MKKRILNLGCGIDTYGTDFVDINGNGDPRIIELDMNCNPLPFGDETFEEVFSCDLFDHLYDKSNFLKESYRVLKYCGRLVLICDNAECIFKRGHKNYQSILNDAHYSFHTSEHLIAFFAKTEFSKMTCGYCYEQTEVVDCKRKRTGSWRYLTFVYPFRWLAPNLLNTQIWAIMEKK